MKWPCEYQLLLVAIVTVASLPSLGSWLPGTVAQQEVDQSHLMKWVRASNERALCNDYTRAGFFIRRNESSNDWIVFLESGGLCYNTDSCNKRFFTRKVREEFRDDSLEEAFPTPYGPFDPSRAWRETILEGRDPTLVISPLMTSMQCYRNVSEYFPSDFSIEGRDLLDTDWTRNRLFYSYNHVVIPYCSSDVWLGEETTNTESIDTNTPYCDCFNYTGCFTFDPESPRLQFTLRGKIIYQSIIDQLLTDHGMANADKVIVAGSSAGGLGAINHAKWTRGKLNSSTELMVLTDSSWFIDFQNSIGEIFNGETGNISSSGVNQDLLEIVKSNPACSDTDKLGYPCCISAACMLTQRNDEGELLYYPEDTPTFALFSIYDVYLLAPALVRVASLEALQETSNTGNNLAGVDTLLDFVRVAGEYGGIMQYTLDTTVAVQEVPPFLSYYVTQCFQHIYLATSTLWGEDDHSVFGSDSIEVTRGTTSFSHSISSGRWNGLILAADGSGNPATVVHALSSWLDLNRSESIRYNDTSCQGILCNPQCPSDLRLGELTSNNWHIGAKITIAALIAGLAVACVMAKVWFGFWILRLEKKQRDYLETLNKDKLNAMHVGLQFPECGEDNKISVTCLDLSYSVKLKKQTVFKDEKDDETSPILLQDLVEEDSDQGPLAKSTINSDKAKPDATKPIKPRRGKLVRQKLSYDAEATGTLPSPSWSAEDEGASDLRRILDGISAFFNPGNLVGIMGPSGCGKTTLLDLLTGRRRAGFIKGTVYVNGSPIDDLREWYIANTGYVLQLATPYYEELTVRENLTLAAEMKLPRKLRLHEKFQRIEKVMHMTGLQKLATVKVGGSYGPGLSGGQKKRLVIALQLITLPSVLFLDEPTSGLDATSSHELLTHLNKLADSNRTVVLTIHQPRLEIFHMFHQLVLLSDGKVSYHDTPDKAYERFVNALASRYLDHGRVIPTLLDQSHNPADLIMDMLGNPKMRDVITESYHYSPERKLVRAAIQRVRWKKYGQIFADSPLAFIKYVVFGTKNIAKDSSTFTRLAVLEARADKRASKAKLAFLPFIMFLVFGFVLGTSYIQTTRSLLVISGMCVFSTASALFMFPAMFLYFKPALVMYKFEKADGHGFSYEIVAQGFIRFASAAVLPVVASVVIIYFLLISHESYDVLAFFQVLLVNIALNQTWIALLTALICATPDIAFRLSPVIAAVAGFSSGFFIPIDLMHWGYRWIYYINPNYFGLSSVAFFVLSDFQTDCTGSQLECYISSGPYTLGQFFYDDINPYLHLVILLGFTLFFLAAAVFANWLRHTKVFNRLENIGRVWRKLSDSDSTIQTHHEMYEKELDVVPEEDEESDLEEPQEGGEYTLIEESGVPEVAETRVDESIQPSRPSKREAKREKPEIWIPDKQPQLADLVLSFKRSQKSKNTASELPRTTSQRPDLKLSLKARQQMLNNRIQITQAVLPGELLNSESREPKKKRKITFKQASEEVMARQRRLRVSDIVSDCVAKMKEEGSTDVSATLSKFTTPGASRRLVTQLSEGGGDRQGSIPLDTWRRIAREHCPST